MPMRMPFLFGGVQAFPMGGGYRGFRAANSGTHVRMNVPSDRDLHLV